MFSFILNFFGFLFISDALTLGLLSFLLVNWAKSASILFIFSQEETHSFIDYLLYLLSVSLISVSIFIISFYVLDLGSVCSCFSKLMSCIPNLFTCALIVLMLVIRFINPPLRTSFMWARYFVVFSFCLSSRKFFYFKELFLWLIYHPTVCCAMPMIFCNYKSFYCCWYKVLLYCGHIAYKELYQFFCICQELFYVHIYGIFLKKLSWAAE